MQFAIEYPQLNKEWFEKSNYLGFLSVDNENNLLDLSRRAIELGIECSIFREPDIDNEVTAIAIGPGKKSKKLCSKLKLALNNQKT